MADLEGVCRTAPWLQAWDRIHKTHLHLSAKSHLSVSVTLN